MLGDQIAVALQNARLYGATKGEIPDSFREILASMAQWAYEPMKGLATSTYALKANVEKGSVSCADDTLQRLLSSMEHSLEQMATFTELLNKLASPEVTADEEKRIKQKIRRLKAS
jgi:hypothetical protein